MKKILASIGVLALGLAHSAAAAARSTASALLTVPGTTRGTLIAAELKRATSIALGAAGVAAGLSAFLLSLSTDTPFLGAVAAILQGFLVAHGVPGVPATMIVSLLSFILARSSALAALLQRHDPGPAELVKMVAACPRPIHATPAVGTADKVFQADGIQANGIQADCRVGVSGRAGPVIAAADKIKALNLAVLLSRTLGVDDTLEYQFVGTGECFGPVYGNGPDGLAEVLKACLEGMPLDIRVSR